MTKNQRCALKQALLAPLLKGPALRSIWVSGESESSEQTQPPRFKYSQLCVGPSLGGNRTAEM